MSVFSKLINVIKKPEAITSTTYPSTSIVFFNDTNEIYTHGKYFGGNFGTGTTQYIPTTLGNKSKNLSIEGHTHKLSDLTDDILSGKYLPLTGGTMTGTPYIIFPNGPSPNITTSTPTGLQFGRLSSWGPFSINVNSDNSGTEYLILTAGHGLSSSTADGVSIGTDTFKWRNNNIWHAGNSNLNTVNWTASTMQLNGSGTSFNGDTYLEFWRNNNASWKILNKDGNLIFQNNWNGGLGSYFNALQLNVTTSNATFRGDVTAPKFIGILEGNATSATNLAGGAKGSIPYQSAQNTTTFLAASGANKVLKMDSSGVPIWADDVDTNTHYITRLYIGDSTSKASSAVTNPYLKLYDDNTQRSKFQIFGSTTISVNSDTAGNIIISDNIITITKTLTITTDWQDTGISGGNLSTDSTLLTGSYCVQISGMNSSTGFWDEIFTGFMSWYAGGTNSTESDEILLHKAGHANTNNTLYLRTIRSATPGYMRLQIAADIARTSSSYTFKFKRLI